MNKLKMTDDKIIKYYEKNLVKLKSNYTYICLHKLTEEELKLLTQLHDYNILKREKIARKEQLLEILENSEWSNGEILEYINNKLRDL